jgi:hypothetical protein
MKHWTDLQPGVRMVSSECGIGGGVHMLPSFTDTHHSQRFHDLVTEVDLDMIVDHGESDVNYQLEDSSVASNTLY